MLTVDHQMHYRAANRPARLLFRLSLDELTECRVGDLMPPDRRPFILERWARLMATGLVAGSHDAEFPDGGQLRVAWCGVANALPGQHLIVLAPADWPEDELIEDHCEVGERQRVSLTQREREVLNLIAAGADQQQIADELTIAVPTVRTHVRNLLRKLGARNRPHAIALAMQDGVLEVRPLSPDERIPSHAACGAA
jgi:DNA-binding CsgD family transcriptional regulator